MNDKNAKDAILVAQYKAAAALRLAKRRADNKAPSAESVPPRGVVVTVRFARGAKPMSDFGGVGKVLGPSCIQIPDYKQQRS